MVDPKSLHASVAGNPFWVRRLGGAWTGDAGLHLGVFHEPYLTYVLEGQKTVESRLGVTKQPPFGRVRRGDILLVKRCSGPIVALAHVSDVWYYELEGRGLQSVLERFGTSLCLEDGFIQAKASAAFATLMRLSHVHQLSDVKVNKRDRRGWVVLGERRTE